MNSKIRDQRSTGSTRPRCFPQLVGCFRCPIRSRLQNARLIKVRHHGGVILTFPKALFVDPNVPDLLERVSLKPRAADRFMMTCAVNRRYPAETPEIEYSETAEAFQRPQTTEKTGCACRSMERQLSSLRMSHMSSGETSLSESSETASHPDDASCAPTQDPSSITQHHTRGTSHDR
jgi:hypothetical protein